MGRMGGLAFLLCLAPGCLLESDDKDHCRRSADCDPGRVCNESGLCEPGGGMAVLGPLETVAPLKLARAQPTAHRVGDWLYVIGGRTPTPTNLIGASTVSIERAHIAADDTLEDFELLADFSLLRARMAHSS